MTRTVWGVELRDEDVAAWRAGALDMVSTAAWEHAAKEAKAATR